MSAVTTQLVYRKPLVDDNFSDTTPALLKTVLRNRGIASEQDLDYALNGLIPPNQLQGIDQACAIIFDIMARNEKILIVGDFDADGATSTAVAISALNEFGHSNVEYIVPNRFEYGYGLSPEIVDLVVERQPSLVITVDNGISSIEGVEICKEYGIKVIVTDHHLPGAEQPAADAIVNPNNHGDNFPSKALAGVGVIFYVMLALRKVLRERGWFADRKEPNLGNLLDLVALGTVADVVPLDHNNRRLVSQGLARMRKGHARPGIQALAQVAGVELSRIKSQDLGFFLGPRLNAAGRLDDISIGIACLLSHSISEAQQLAALLHQLNDERKAVEASMQSEAFAILENLDSKANPHSVVLYDETWHQGVVGLVASRIKDRFHRPTVVFAQGDNGQLKGSARSIEGFHIRDAFDEVAKQAPNIMKKFGGHAMAAGLSINERDFAEFTEVFERVAANHLNEDTLQRKVLIDADIEESQLDMMLSTMLEQSQPWGQHFPEPTFSARVSIEDKRLLKEKHVKWRFKLGEQTIHAIAFNCVDNGWFEYQGEARIVFTAGVNHFRNNQTMQWMVRHMEPA